MMTLQELKQKKKELGYSNQRVAELSGLPFGTVQKIFGGVTKTPRHETLEALERALRSSSLESAILREDMQDGTTVRHRLYTIEDYDALPKDTRAELIDGVFYDLAAPSHAHQVLLGKLYILLDECIRKHEGDCHVMFAPVDVQLDQNDETMLQPDLILFCGMENLRNGRYVGAPRFIAEILSPSTRTKDMFIKLNKYRFAGVEEYWIVDPQYRQVTVYDLKHESAPDKYSFTDRIPLGISESKCIIDFSRVYEDAKPFLELEL